MHKAVNKIHKCFGGGDSISTQIREDACQLYDNRLGLEPGIMSRAYEALKGV
ncbi:MAG: hypothetical protein ACFB2W_00935 [Leptolyngbyaceae cyanobacterium]